MSMSLANADTYIAQIYGGASDTGVKAQARDSLKAAMEMWGIQSNWSFLRQDTSNTFTVAGCTAAATTLTTSVTNGFKNVLVGMTITGTGITAGTTISAIASNTSLTLSASATSSNQVLTFGGTIPIIAGTAVYNLPSTFDRPYSCRLVSTLKTPLVYVAPNVLDLLTYDQTIQGTVTHYTLYNSAVFDSSGTQQGKIKFWRVPQASDVALLKYYRQFDGTLDPVDCADSYLYTLLDTARVFLLRSKNATDARLPLLEANMRERLAEAINNDVNEAGEDEYTSFISPMDVTRGGSFTGYFYPSGDTIGGNW